MHWCPMCDNPFGEASNDCHVCSVDPYAGAEAKKITVLQKPMEYVSVIQQAEQVYQQMASVGVARINVASGEDVCLMS